MCEKKDKAAEKENVQLKKSKDRHARYYNENTCNYLSVDVNMQA